VDHGVTARDEVVLVELARIGYAGGHEVAIGSPQHPAHGDGAIPE